MVPVGNEKKVYHKVLLVALDDTSKLTPAILEFCGGRKLVRGISEDKESAGRIEKEALKLAKGKSDTN